MYLLLILQLSLAVADEPPPSGAPVSMSASVAVWIPTYEAVRLALAADLDGEARTAAQQLSAMAAADPSLLAAMDTLLAASDLASRRLAFREVSRLLVLRVAADPGAPKFKFYRCTMTPGYGYWLQTRAGILNPYMGTAMPTCGEEVSLRQALSAAGGTR